MSGAIPNRQTVALVLVIMLGVASVMAAKGTELPFARLYRLLHVRPGAYYLVSPEIVASIEHGAGGKPGYNIDLKIKQVKLGVGYVMVYGEREGSSGRVELARENMAIIESHLAAASPAMPRGSTVDQMGFPDINSLVTQTNYVCLMDLINKPRSQLIVPTIGKKLSYVRFCVGLGIGAALAGYKIEAVNQGLQFRRVLDIKQGAATK